MRRALAFTAITIGGVALSSSPAWASPVDTVGEAPGAAVHPASSSPPEVRYQAAPGDSFWSIGQRFGVGMADLAAWNHLDLWSGLNVGQVLVIPPAGWRAPATPSAATPAYRTAAAQVRYPASRGAVSPSGSGSAPGGIWACIAAHESGGNPATNTGNGYYGMYQFSPSTWQAAGGTGNPANASAAEQTAVAERVQQMQGWSAWPVTSRECGA